MLCIRNTVRRTPQHCTHPLAGLECQQGPIVRIAPNEVSFASPEAAKDILTTGKGYRKTDFYSVFPPPENPDLFTELREEVHSVKKRMASTAYSMNSMLQMEGSSTIR